VGLNQANKPQLEILNRDRADVPSRMKHVPNHDQPILPRFRASVHITDSRGPWFRLLPPPPLAPVSPLLHPRRCRALAGAALVVTRWVWRMRGTFCPQEAHRERLSKSRSTGSTSRHLDHRRHCCLAPLFLIDLALCRRTITGVSCGCAIFGTGEMVLPISCAGFSSGGI
jgi:hypothetical protein